MIRLLSKSKMKKPPPYIVSWFSAGVSSAVATKLVIDQVDEIIYTHINDQHPDTLRFVKDCEKWFGKPITILQSPMKTVEESIRKKGYGWIKGLKNDVAFCTLHLKKRVRQNWIRENAHKAPFIFVWGFDPEELDRIDRLRNGEPEYNHIFPLLDRGISKVVAHEIITQAGIKRPIMYELGYHNNNCIGCVKGGMGYWNKIRKDFPEVFAQRAKLERELGSTILRVGYLDELNPRAGRHDKPITGECGLFCGTLGDKNQAPKKNRKNTKSPL